MHTYVLFVCMYVCECGWPEKPEEGVGSLRTRVASGCELPCGCWELNPVFCKNIACSWHLCLYKFWESNLGSHVCARYWMSHLSLLFSFSFWVSLHLAKTPKICKSKVTFSNIKAKSKMFTSKGFTILTTCTENYGTYKSNLTRYDWMCKAWFPFYNRFIIGPYMPSQSSLPTETSFDLPQPIAAWNPFQSQHPLLFLPSAAALPQSIGLILCIPFSHNLTISLSTFYWMWLLKTIKNPVAWSPSASLCVLTEAWEITHCLQSLPCLFASCLHLHTAHAGLQSLTSLAPWYSSCQLSRSLSFVCLLLFVILKCGLKVHLSPELITILKELLLLLNPTPSHPNF